MACGTLRDNEASITTVIDKYMKVKTNTYFLGVTSSITVDAEWASDLIYILMRVYEKKDNITYTSSSRTTFLALVGFLTWQVLQEQDYNLYNMKEINTYIVAALALELVIAEDFLGGIIIMLNLQRDETHFQKQKREKIFTLWTLYKPWDCDYDQMV